MIHTTRDVAQAFFDSVNTNLDAQGFKGTFYWDDGVPRDEKDRIIGGPPSADATLPLFDWTGYLVFTNKTPLQFTLNEQTVRANLRDGVDHAYYDTETLYRAWAAPRLVVRFTIDRLNRALIEEQLANMAIAGLSIEPAPET